MLPLRISLVSRLCALLTPSGGKARSRLSTETNVLLLRNLPFGITDYHLKPMFPGCVDTDIPVDTETGRPKRYAFVKYSCVENARAALEKTKGLSIGGRVIKMKYAVTVDGKPESGEEIQFSVGRPTEVLFLWNLPFEMTDYHLRPLFHGCVDITISLDKTTGRQKGCAYVEYSSINEAMTALEKVQGLELGGRVVRVKYAPLGDSIPKAIGSEENCSKPTNVLLLRNLPYGTTGCQLKPLFPGSVDVNVPVDTKTGRPKRYAFVEFQSIEKAERAVEELFNRLRLGGHSIFLHYSKMINDHSDPSSTLLLKSFPLNATEQQLKKLFPDSIDIRMRAANRLYRFAFVEFSSVQEAEAVLETSDEFMIGDRPLHVEFAGAREQRGTAQQQELLEDDNELVLK